MSRKNKTGGYGKRFLTVLLTLAMIVSLTPSLGSLTTYAATDTITRVELSISPDNLDQAFHTGDPVVQPAFTVTGVESISGTVEISDLSIEQDQYFGWCHLYDDGGNTDWFKYQDDGIQGLVFTEGESRMMVDIWVDGDAVFNADTVVYLNGSRMEFYKTYASDTDWVGYISRTALPVGSVVSEIDISYDLDALHFNTAHKETEVSALISDGGVTANGPGYSSIDWGDTLNWHEPGTEPFNWNSSSEEDSYLTTDREYSIFINAISLKDGYDYPDSIKAYPDGRFLSGDNPNIIVRVNGEVRDDIELHYLAGYSSYGQVLGVNIPIGKPPVVYVAPQVTLSGSNGPMEPGHTRTFSAEITGTISDRTIIWSVSGNNSTDTEITDGTLTIGADESAVSVTITAASAVDSTLSESMVIPISYTIKPVDYVEIYPAEATAFRGFVKQFSAEVVGEQENKTVSWTVSGSNSAATSISSTGLLSVGADESANTITVTATSVADPTKSASADVEIQDSLMVTEIDISYDLDALHFDTDHKGTEVSTLIGDGGVTASGSGYSSIDWGDALNWHEPGTEPFNWNSSSEENAYLTTEREYSIFVNGIVLEDGCYFPDSIKAYPDGRFLSGDNPDIVVRVNGEVRDDIELHYLASYSSYGQVLGINIPIGKPHVSLDKVDFAPIPDETYTGKALTPAITATYNGTKLVEDIDFTLSYSNNTNPGTATVTITGKGKYTGEVTKTFQIIKKTGWVKEGGYWYFYNADGTMAKSTWKKDSKGWCYLGADGKMVANGWAKDSKGYVWMNGSGYWDSGTKWIKYDGGWYHITNGYRDQNKWKKDSKGWCYLGSDGRMVTNGWAKDSKGWCWMGADGYWVANKWVKDKGEWYYIKSNHYMAASGKITKSKWVKSGGYWYYLKDNGYMATGTLTIGGKTYRFDSSGRWIE